jgi:GNAT superfamily N-acetyltransferase
MLGGVIRPYDDADAEAAAALVAEHSPWLQTAAGLRHRLAALPPRAHRATWVAEIDGEIVGWAEAEFDWTAERTDIGQAWVLVAPSHRGRGYGSELFERAIQHLTAHDAGELRSWSFPDGEAFLVRRGFTRTRVERLSALDPSSVDTSRLESLPSGVRIVPLGELDARLSEVHAVFAEALADMPADHPETNLPYEEWLTETIGDPDLSHEGSVVVLVDDRPAALSWVNVDGDRGYAEQHLTGTARAYRRRGLARLAKLAVIRWCAEAGVVRLATGNDATNTGMLAINDELGFRPFATETQWVKPLR